MLSDTALGGPKKEEISPVDRGFFEASALEVVFAGAKLGRCPSCDDAGKVAHNISGACGFQRPLAEAGANVCRMLGLNAHVYSAWRWRNVSGWRRAA